MACVNSSENSEKLIKFIVPVLIHLLKIYLKHISATIQYRAFADELGVRQNDGVDDSLIRTQAMIHARLCTPSDYHVVVGG